MDYSYDVINNYFFEPRFGHTTTLDEKNGIIYIFGGVKSDGASTNELLSYDIKQNKFKKIEYNTQKNVNIKGRFFHVGIDNLVDNKIIIYGGVEEDNQPQLNLNTDKKRERFNVVKNLIKNIKKDKKEENENLFTINLKRKESNSLDLKMTLSEDKKEEDSMDFKSFLQREGSIVNEKEYKKKSEQEVDQKTLKNFIIKEETEKKPTGLMGFLKEENEKEFKKVNSGNNLKTENEGTDKKSSGILKSFLKKEEKESKTNEKGKGIIGFLKKDVEKNEKGKEGVENNKGIGIMSFLKEEKNNGFQKEEKFKNIESSNSNSTSNSNLTNTDTNSSNEKNTNSNDEKNTNSNKEKNTIPENENNFVNFLKREGSEIEGSKKAFLKTQEERRSRDSIIKKKLSQKETSIIIEDEEDDEESFIEEDNIKMFKLNKSGGIIDIKHFLKENEKIDTKLDFKSVLIHNKNNNSDERLLEEEEEEKEGINLFNFLNENKNEEKNKNIEKEKMIIKEYFNEILIFEISNNIVVQQFKLTDLNLYFGTLMFYYENNLHFYYNQRYENILNLHSVQGGSNSFGKSYRNKNEDVLYLIDVVEFDNSIKKKEKIKVMKKSMESFIYFITPDKFINQSSKILTVNNKLYTIGQSFKKQNNIFNYPLLNNIVTFSFLGNKI
jgi:hypothetical protein